MNPKIAHLQQRNVQARLRQRYAFLNIADIQSTDGDIARRFIDSGIYRLTNPAAATFPFHQSGIIDRPLHQAQHQAARAEMVRRIRALLVDTVWISLSENDFGFWACISLPVLQAALDHWFEQHDDFSLYLENGYALAIHEAEYEWELLETRGRPLEAT
ncbi:hypothetical protein A7P92_00290 [Eikenella corrodens]|uniref:hypothetical protein n=1 Tax=Eikenella corrodens TaxID=539 RepID=UPI0007D0B7EC|nr:hypothetical protein [Eikenella corrodens]OAM25079.1 hypothetical protein A7P92_00290 [Eikenella corrodens]